MTEDEAIRLKFISWGASKMSDEELLSIVMRGEEKSGESLIALSRDLLSHFDGNLLEIHHTPYGSLRKIKGLGHKRAAYILASLELGWRLSREKAYLPRKIGSMQDVVEIFRPELAPLEHEEFWALYMSSANTVLEKYKVSTGGVSGTVVDYKMVIRRALELLASSVILVHNHPSGVARPSGEDKEITERIAQAASLFDISVLDHIIITSGDYFSFRQAGLISGR